MNEWFLTTERLGFRRWTARDLPLAQRLWGDPEVTRHIAARPYTTAEVEQRLAREIAADAAHGLQYWPMFRRADDAFVGCCGLRPREPGMPELGFHVVHAHWRNGYAREAATAVIAYAFGELGCTALFAGHNPRNVASRGLLLDLGFEHTHDELYEPTGLMHPSYRLFKTRSKPA